MWRPAPCTSSFPVTAAAMRAARRSLSKAMVRSVAARNASSLAVSAAMWATMARCSSIGGIGSHRLRTESCPMFCIELLAPVASLSNSYRPAGDRKKATRYSLHKLDSFTPSRYNLSQSNLMCDSLSGLHSYEPIEVQRRPPELKIDEHAYSMRQHFPNEAMVEVPKVMNANARDRKP